MIERTLVPYAHIRGWPPQDRHPPPTAAIWAPTGGPLKRVRRSPLGRASRRRKPQARATNEVHMVDVTAHPGGLTEDVGVGVRVVVGEDRVMLGRVKSQDLYRQRSQGPAHGGLHMRLVPVRPGRNLAAVDDVPVEPTRRALDAKGKRLLLRKETSRSRSRSEDLRHRFPRCELINQLVEITNLSHRLFFDLLDPHAADNARNLHS